MMSLEFKRESIVKTMKQKKKVYEEVKKVEDIIYTYPKEMHTDSHINSSRQVVDANLLKGTYHNFIDNLAHPKKLQSS